MKDSSGYIMEQYDFKLAIDRDEIFDYLIGKYGYEKRMNYAYMPTDPDAVSSEISRYLRGNPDFDIKKLKDVFLDLSKSAEWSWLCVFYAFSLYKTDLLPLNDIYKNIEKNKNALQNNKNWLVFNFSATFDNLWDIIVDRNNKFIAKGCNLPKL